MKRRSTGYVACAICAACLAGCDGGTDGGGANSDLTVYEDDVRAVLEHTFSGAIEDAGHEVPCRFEGQEFAFYMQLASPMSCEDSEGQPADCTSAARGSWELEGELEVDATYQLTGSASIFDLEVLHAALTADLPCYGNSFGDGMLDQLHFDSEISQVDWDIQNDGANTSEWEVCLLIVDSIE